MKVQRLRELVRIRQHLHDTYASEVPGVLERHWEELTRILVEDMPATVAYLRSSEVTADEIGDISEVFDDVVEVCPSQDFIDAVRFAAKRFPDCCERYNILPLLADAERMVKTATRNQEDPESRTVL